ncbi:hypothetical protein SK069_18100 [Patulibacter brassicae]|uniref:Uncharacterized protein n=1 Tax=Patulibacter brassicae TaxID=1705717 RepID=A0ABU4VNU0_9ACTN|nr:hypothetical protein [Patulibacter brassicae]MDX8153517.1 hypothetical protein [Patulibacter brassicae]
MFSPVRIVRFWLPLLIFAIGAAMLIISPDIVGIEGAALMLGGGLGVAVSNRLHRIGLKGEQERDQESDQRAFLARYGVWPDEASPEVLAQARRDGVLPEQDEDDDEAAMSPGQAAVSAMRPQFRSGEVPRRRRTRQ